LNVLDELNEPSEPSNRVRWLGAVLILVALAALIWQALLAGQGDELPPLEPVITESAPTRLSLGEMLASADTSRFSAQAASAAAAAALAASATIPPNEAEICGVGRVKADDSGAPLKLDAIQQAAQQARERLLPVLANDADETARALGLFLQSTGSPKVADAAVPASASARDSLARMAVATRSPQTYALALRACQGQRGAGTCQMLSAEQWVQLDPGNAMLWLQVATDAQVRGDAAAVAEALYRASNATSADLYLGSIASMALAKLPTDVRLPERGALAAELLAIQANGVTPHLVASQYCSVTAVHDSNRQQVCASLAEVLARKGGTLTDAGLSATIGQRVGWPAERVAAARDEVSAMAQLQKQSVPAPNTAWSCASLVQMTNQIAQVGQGGELNTMRNALKRSADDAATLAKRYREAEARRATQAASPASGASSAPP
jgi:hypothetical protein